MLFWREKNVRRALALSDNLGVNHEALQGDSFLAHLRLGSMRIAGGCIAKLGDGRHDYMKDGFDAASQVKAADAGAGKAAIRTPSPIRATTSTSRFCALTKTAGPRPRRTV